MANLCASNLIPSHWNLRAEPNVCGRWLNPQSYGTWWYFEMSFSSWGSGLGIGLTTSNIKEEGTSVGANQGFGRA